MHYFRCKHCNVFHRIRIARLNKFPFSLFCISERTSKVQSIERYGDGGKYKLNFNGSAKKISEIKFGKAKRASMQGIRYTNLNKLLNAKEIIDI